MFKHVSIVLSILIMSFIIGGCMTKQQTIQYIVTTDSSMQMKDVEQASEALLKEDDSNIVIEDVEYCDEHQYIVTIQTSLDEDTILSLLKESDWVKKVLINYEVKLY